MLERDFRGLISQCHENGWQVQRIDSIDAVVESEWHHCFATAKQQQSSGADRTEQEEQAAGTDYPIRSAESFTQIVDTGDGILIYEDTTAPLSIIHFMALPSKQGTPAAELLETARQLVEQWRYLRDYLGCWTGQARSGNKFVAKACTGMGLKANYVKAGRGSTGASK